MARVSQVKYHPGSCGFAVNQFEWVMRPPTRYPVVVLTSSHSAIARLPGPLVVLRASLKMPRHLIQSSFYQTREIFNVLFRRIEGCHESHFRRFLIPNVEEILFLE
jgi:hypothetical protein